MEKAWYNELENEDWVKRIMSPSFKPGNEDVFEQYTDGTLHNYYGTIWQRKILPWNITYRLLKIFNRFKVHIMFPIEKEMFDLKSITESTVSVSSKFDDMLDRGYVNDVHTELMPDGNVMLELLVEEGDHGDEDGFGVEPDIWANGIMGKDGKMLKLFGI